MINFEALFKISYGLYIVSSGDRNRGNGFISNTVFQVTAEPPRFASCCNKNNFTSEFIIKSGAFSVSVLKKDTAPEIMGRFGYKSGRDFDKMEGMKVEYGSTGVPIVLEETVAFLECKVIQTIDAGTHWLFIADLLKAEIVDDIPEPLTYKYYREVKKGMAPKNAPTYIDKSKLEKKTPGGIWKKFKCSACGYIYNEEDGDPINGIKPGTRFAELPSDWVCPICGTPKEDFFEIE